MESASYWIEKLKLQAHPEGGFFKETYRSEEMIPKAALPERFSGDRNFSTGIYFLLDKTDVSAFHRIQQDEMWHFYDGSALMLHVIDLEGVYSMITLGKNMDDGQTPQLVVKAGCFFAAEVNDKELFSLTGCTVAPGFDFEDFVMPSQADLIELFPQHEKIIKQFTK